MIRFIRHILAFSGKEASKIKTAFLPAFLKALLTNIIVFYSLLILMKLLNGSYSPRDSVIIGVVILITLALEAIFQYATDRLQSAAGFEILAEKRKQLGAHLQRLPMGFFTEGNIGKISSVLATDMTFIEENAMTAIANTVSEMFTVAILDIFPPSSSMARIAGTCLPEGSERLPAAFSSAVKRLSCAGFEMFFLKSAKPPAG